MAVSSALDISASGADNIASVTHVTLESGDTLTFDASQTNDTLNIDGNNANSDVIIKAAADDTKNIFTNFVNSGGAGGGNIILDIVQNVDKAGDGAGILGDIDTINLSDAAKAITLDANQISNLTTLNGSGTLNVNAVGGVADLSGLTNGNFSGTLNIIADSTKADTITGSSFDDNIVYSGTAQADTLDGGAGTNTITHTILINGDADLTALTGANVTNITKMDVSGNFTATIDKDFAENSGITTYTGASGTTDFIKVALGDGEDINLTSQIFADLKVKIDVAGGGNLDSTIVGNDEVVNIISAADGANTITTFDSNDTIAGGTGKDIISSAGGNDIINSGDGDDTIAVGSGTDTVDAGANNDTIIIAKTSLSSSDTLNGGSGDDILELSGGGTLDDTVFSNVSNIQTLKTDDADTTINFSTNAGSITTVDASSMTTSTSNLDLTTGSALNNVTGGAGADSITYKDANLTSADTLDGAGGTDTLIISDGADITMSDLSKVTNIEVMKLSDNDNTVDISSSSFTSVLGGSKDDTLTIDTVPTGTLDGGGETTIDTLKVLGDLDLSGANIINFEKIVTNDSITLNIAQASGITMAIASGKTLTIKDSNGTGTLNAANITGGQLNIASITAALAITGLATKLDASSITQDLSVKTADGSLDIAGSTETANTTVEYTGDTTLSGTFSDIDQFSVSSGKTLKATAANITGKNINGAGNIVVNVNADSSQDFDNLELTGTEIIQFTGDSTFTGDFQNSTVSVDTGVTLSADGAVIDGKIVGGAGTLNITGTGDGNLDLSKVTSVLTANIDDGATTLSGVSVNLDASNSSSNLTVDVQTGVTSVVTGSGADDIQLAADDMTSSLTIDGNGASDKITLTTSATDLASGDFANISNVETVNFFTGNDTLNIASGDTKLDNIQLNLGAGADTYKTDADDFSNADKIDGGTGTDSIVFNDTMSKDYETDFANVSAVENFVGSSNDDSFTLDFSSIATMKTNGELFDGAGGSDNVSLKASNLNLSSDTTVNQLVFDNIETLDVTGISFNAASSDIVLDTATLKSWTDGTTDGNGNINFTLDITDDTQGQKFTLHDTTANNDVQTELSTTGGANNDGHYVYDGLDLYVV
jgi:hypothetical protein